MNENVKKVLSENMWDIITMSDEPDVASIAFKTVLPDGKLAVADVFLTKTLENIKANGIVVVSAFNSATMEGYKLCGTAQHITEGEIFENLAAVANNRSKGRLKAKGALLIDVKKIYATTPGADKNPL